MPIRAIHKGRPNVAIAFRKTLCEWLSDSSYAALQKAQAICYIFLKFMTDVRSASISIFKFRLKNALHMRNGFFFKLSPAHQIFSAGFQH